MRRIPLSIPVFMLLSMACSSPEPAQPPEAATTEQPSALPVALAESSVAVLPPDTAMAVQPGEAPVTKPTSTIAANPSIPAPALAPNTIRVSASVVSVQEEGNGGVVTLRIEKVSGRGAATPPLTTGNEVRARIGKTVDPSAKLAQPGAVVDVTMQSQKSLAGVQPPPPSWQIITVH